MKALGEIKKIDIKKIWPNEERDFTPWLAENIEKLSKILGMELELIAIEATVGNFSLDILAKDTGRNCHVVIENQYGNTDHKHLGQLLTYAAGFNSGTVIWISEEIREEHRKLLDWLNEKTDDDLEFYGVVIEVIQIDDSKPAFNFKLIASPNKWSKGPSVTHNLSSKMLAYKNYFQDLIDTLRIKYKFTNAQKAQPQSWCAFSTGIRGIQYSTNFAQGNKVRAEIYIDTEDTEKNKKILKTLEQNKSIFIKEFGEEPVWEILEQRRASRIAIYRNGSIEDKELLKEFKEWSIEKLLKFKNIVTKNNVVNEILKGNFQHQK